jgi:hypothetical protein
MHPESIALHVAGSGWLAEARRALADLGLPTSWSEESVEAPGIRTSRLADCALRQLAEIGLRPDHMLACTEGGIRFAFGRQGRYAEIEFLNGGEVIATCSAMPGETPRNWLVSPGGTGFEATFNTIRAFLGA